MTARLICFALSLALTGSHLCAQGETPTPLELARKVADKVIRETSFQFAMVPQEPGNTIQVLDFGRAGAMSNGEVWYAVSDLRSAPGSEYFLGVCHTMPVKVWMNGVQVYVSDGRTPGIRKLPTTFTGFLPGCLSP